MGRCLRGLCAKLRAEWSTIKKVLHGSAQLYDILDWHERNHMRDHAALAKTLTGQLVKRTSPLLTLNTWPDHPGQFSWQCRPRSAKAQ